VKFTNRSLEEARRVQVSTREPIKPPGWYTSTCVAALDTFSRRNNPMIEIHHLVQLPDGSQRELRDWLVDAEATAEKVRSAIESVECLDRMERGEAITGADFAGKTVQILVGIEKRGRGQPDKNEVQLYRAVPSAVVTPIRSAS
jgi:hypothetical protein